MVLRSGGVVHDFEDHIVRSSGQVLRREQMGTLRGRDERGIRHQMAECSVIDMLQAVCLEKAKVASVNDRAGIDFTYQIIYRGKSATNVAYAENMAMVCT